MNLKQSFQKRLLNKIWGIGIMVITVDCRSTNRSSILLYPESFNAPVALNW